METILNYFETIPSLHRGIIIVGGLTFFWLIEGAFPLFNFNYKNLLPDDYDWGNGFVGNPFAYYKSNFAAFTTGIPYFGLDLLLNYTFQIQNNILLQPEIGVKLMSMPRYSLLGYERSSVCGNSGGNCISFHSETADNFENKRQFFPDLAINLNFLIFNKRPNNNLRLGLSLNYGFVPRYEGNYEITNLGPLNSSGKMKYGSSYFGFNVGYQFLGIPKKDTSQMNNFLFNPRY